MPVPVPIPVPILIIILNLWLQRPHLNTESCFLSILGAVRVINTTLSGSDLGLCASNHSDFGGNGHCKDETFGGNTLYYVLFILGMVIAGAGCTPMIALGIPYMDENVSANVSPMYVGIFFASGISGELS